MSLDRWFSAVRTSIVGALVAGACTVDARRAAVRDTELTEEAARSAPDCFGSDSLPAIDVGHVGALRLDTPILVLRRVCPNLRDTIVPNGDEGEDTAIVISRPGLAAVGRIATVDAGGEVIAVKFDSTTRAERWTITGSRGLLPRGLPLNSTLGALARGYGPSRASGLNGEELLTFCSGPIQLEVGTDAPAYTHFPEPVDSSSLTPVLAKARVTRVDVRARDGGPSPGPCPRK
jgi:hypothetical protein